VRPAYKFLAPGAVSPFTGFRWPRPGEWVSGRPDRPDRWVFACRRADLAYWLDRELWLVELDEPVREARHQISAPRGRLVTRVRAWDEELRRAYAAACASRARELALPALPSELAARVASLGHLSEVAAAVREAPEPSTVGGYLGDVSALAAEDAAAASYVACILAASVRGEAAFEAERSWQAGWLSRHLELAEG